MISFYNTLGKVSMTGDYFAGLVSAAASSCYGVADMATSGASDTVKGMQSVVEYREQVAARYLPHRRIGLLHGKLKAAEKAEVMAQFAAGELDVLCSTTVVEVGVDVPNASVMVIENAERYGLSALHQLRGRVGRGAAESFCILVSDHGSEAVKERLGFLCRTSDGFEVAKYDLEHRGPGDFFGERQHGLPTLQVADATDAGMLGGILIGVVESLSKAYIGTLTGGVITSAFSDAIVFAILIVVLLVKPAGILGSNAGEKV